MKSSAAGKNDPCPCGSGRKYRQCCWLRRFDRAATATAVKGQFESCKCGSGKKYRRCCYPRVFPDFTKRNGGIEPHLERAAEDRAFARMQALFDRGLPSNQTIDTIEVGTGRLDCAALPPTGPGENVAGTLGPPTPRQVEAKYDSIRESNPDGVTEVVVTYTYPEMFGHAEARMAFDADEHFRLEDGSVVSVLKLSAGMRLRMADGGVGTIVEHPERRYEYPLPPIEVQERQVVEPRHRAGQAHDARDRGVPVGRPSGSSHAGTPGVVRRPRCVGPGARTPQRRTDPGVREHGRTGRRLPHPSPGSGRGVRDRGRVLPQLLRRHRAERTVGPQRAGLHCQARNG